MTWTATEHEQGTRLYTYIQDENAGFVCTLWAYDNNPAAVEQMRARARLIVQAEAMRDLLAGLKWKSIDKDNMEFECQTTCFVLDKIRTIIVATEGDHG